MSLTVTLNVYSGRPNPAWTLPEQAAHELLDRIGRITTTSDLKAGVATGLGYRGFVVNGPDYGVAPTYIRAGLVDQGHVTPTLVADDRDLEKWLLSTAEGHVEDAVRAHVQESLGEPVATAISKIGPVVAACPVCHAVDAPVYNPAIWNTPSVQPNNNCYNYANNRITNTFAQPGRATGHMYTALTCPAVTAAAHSDGLVNSPNFTAPLAAGHGWYVALVIWPGQDYHWYRQDKVGCWSHKPGSTPARNTDNSGHAISDPKTANRGPYTQFCTYMITKSTVHIR